jgi:putative endonuclease
MVELVDTQDLKSCGHCGCAGSIPAPGTKFKPLTFNWLKAFFLKNAHMYYVYVITSINRNYTYIGITNNPERRISQHNFGYNRTTKPYRPFETLLIEDFSTRALARQREKYLKSGIGREFIKSTYLHLCAGLSTDR